jgi:hypothetical protein
MAKRASVSFLTKGLERRRPRVLGYAGQRLSPGCRSSATSARTESRVPSFSCMKDFLMPEKTTLEEFGWKPVISALKKKLPKEPS